MTAHLEQIQRVNPQINAAVEVLARNRRWNKLWRLIKLWRLGKDLGPLHGVPFSIKDSIDVQGSTDHGRHLG